MHIVTRAATLGLIAIAGLACADDFSLSSPDVPANGTLKLAQVYAKGGCGGANVAPALSWVGEPAGTRRFAITVYDPDAPNAGRGWWHWLLLNIPANVHRVAAKTGQSGGVALPPGAYQIDNDFGEAGYGGACPPKGNAPHRYVFAVWALKADKLNLPAKADGAAVRAALMAQSLGTAMLTAKYGR
jgi:Raf kinase inhibitor-like YbhB/YbcL family protein